MSADREAAGVERLSRWGCLVQAAGVWTPDELAQTTAGAMVRARGSAELRGDCLAREEPLEIRIGDHPLAVVMRTPGHDAELALGFLVTERVIREVREVLSVRHCTRGAQNEQNVIRVLLADGVPLDLDALRRNLYASSSCGICGKATIENALASAPPLADAARFRAETLCAMPAQLEPTQAVFARTGGLHAAGLFDPSGALVVAREDIGRHNAVDKVVGVALRRGLTPLSGHALLVSGRVSYEIVQKALAARIPLVAGVSAPSSLAVELAEHAGIAVVGFLRGEDFNVYSRHARVVDAAAPAVAAAAAASGTPR